MLLWHLVFGVQIGKLVVRLRISVDILRFFYQSIVVMKSFLIYRNMMLAGLLADVI